MSQVTSGGEGNCWGGKNARGNMSEGVSYTLVGDAVRAAKVTEYLVESNSSLPLSL